MSISFAKSDTPLANSLKISQSDLASQGEAIAGLKGWTKGCISVLDKSYFSYQVDAGKITSEYNAVPAILKSRLISKSSFPSAAFLRHLISWGRILSSSEFNNPCDAPNKYFKKYSCPLPELEIKLARQTNKFLGKLYGWLRTSLMI